MSDANGYILQYTPNDETLLVNGSGSLFANIKELTQGTTYQINVYSYRDLPSESSIGVSVLYDGGLVCDSVITCMYCCFDYDCSVK